MKKIITLFKRDYAGHREVYDEVVPGAEWVLDGEGMATLKYDGTCCMMLEGVLYKRYDRKFNKATKRAIKLGYVVQESDFKPAPNEWVQAQEHDLITGHWPGWLRVGNGPEDIWHREAFDGNDPDGTYELCGPKIQGNPEGLFQHVLIPHGEVLFPLMPRTFKGIRQWLIKNQRIEGVVWHHEDGRMVKIKRKDFGLTWPPQHSVSFGGRI